MFGSNMLILPIGMRNQDEPFLINEHDRLILGEEEPAGLPALLLVVIRLHWMWLIRPELQLLPQYHSDLEPGHVQLSGYDQPSDSGSPGQIPDSINISLGDTGERPVDFLVLGWPWGWRNLFTTLLKELSAGSCLGLS